MSSAQSCCDVYVVTQCMPSEKQQR